MGVKKFVRARATKRFLTRDQSWTEDLTGAWSFTDLSEGEATIARLQLLDVEIYYSFGEELKISEWDFCLPCNLTNTTRTLSEAGREVSGFVCVSRRAKGICSPPGSGTKAGRPLGSSQARCWPTGGRKNRICSESTYSWRMQTQTRISSA